MRIRCFFPLLTLFPLLTRIRWPSKKTKQPNASAEVICAPMRPFWYSRAAVPADAGGTVVPPPLLHQERRSLPPASSKSPPIRASRHHPLRTRHKHPLPRPTSLLSRRRLLRTLEVSRQCQHPHPHPRRRRDSRRLPPLRPRLTREQLPIRPSRRLQPQVNKHRQLPPSRQPSQLDALTGCDLRRSPVWEKNLNQCKKSR